MENELGLGAGPMWSNRRWFRKYIRQSFVSKEFVPYVDSVEPGNRNTPI